MRFKSLLYTFCWQYVLFYDWQGLSSMLDSESTSVRDELGINWNS